MLMAIILLLLAGGAASSQKPDELPDVKVLPAPAARLKKRIPINTWSRAGWNAFRWGMGPQDVADRLRDARGDFRNGHWKCTITTPWTFAISCTLYEHAFTVLGVRPVLDFDFIDGRLAQVGLMFYPSGRKFFTYDEGEKLFAELRDLLVKEHGPASHEYETPRETGSNGVGGYSKHANWETPLSFRPNPNARGFEMHLSAHLFTFPKFPEGKANVDLLYSEEGHSDHFTRRARGDPPASDGDKLRGVSQKQ